MDKTLFIDSKIREAQVCLLLLFKASMLNNDGHNFAHFPNTFANLVSEENDVAVTVFTLSSVYPRLT